MKKHRRRPTYGRASACLWGGTRRAASCHRPACRLSATANCSCSSEPRAGWPRWRPGAHPPCRESGAGGCSWTLLPAALPPRWCRGPAAPPCCPSCWALSQPHQRLQEGRCCQRHEKTAGTMTCLAVDLGCRTRNAATLVLALLFTPISFFCLTAGGSVFPAPSLLPHQLGSSSAPHAMKAGQREGMCILPITWIKLFIYLNLRFQDSLYYPS